MSLTLSLSPEFALTRGGEPVELKNRKAQALLVYLALSGQPQRREHLATLLWGDRMEEQARGSLRQTLFALKKAIGGGVVIGDDPLRLADEALPIVTSGELLPGFSTGAEDFDGWLASQRAAETDRAVATLMHEAETMMARLDDHGVLDRYERALALQPLNEAVLRNVMAVLGRLDRRSDALVRFERFRTQMKSELATEPAMETLALAESLRESPTTPDDTDHPNVLVATFEDLGGGELSTFIARGMQEEIALRARSMGFMVVDLPSESAVEYGSGNALLVHARKLGAQCYVTGTTRQMGDTVRGNIRVVATDQGTTVWSHRTIIHGDDVFERMGELGMMATRRFAEFSTRSKTAAELIAQLKGETDRPEAFLATWNNLFWSAFFVTQTRSHMKNVAELSAFAYRHFPKNAIVAATQSLSVFHDAHLQDGKDRMDRYTKADAILQRALALDGGLAVTLAAKLIISTWLGRFQDVDDAYERIKELGVDWFATNGLYMPSLVFRDRNREVIDLIGEVSKQEAGSPLMFYRFAFLGLAHFNESNDAMALRAATNALEVGREFFLGHLVKIATLERLGRHINAAEAFEDMRLDYQDPTVTEFEFLPFTNAERKTAFLNALREAGMPD